MNSLEIKNLTVMIGEKPILKNFFLSIPKGEVHALMGPNGTGKSTLAKALAGHHDCVVTEGEILLNGKNITKIAPHEISRAGLFMAFQYPSTIPGVSIANFIRAAVQARLNKGDAFNVVKYYQELYEKMDLLGIDRNFTSRAINDGFSGGEKKRCEILQMLMLKPFCTIMDETDSGLDIDALKIVANGVNLMRNKNNSTLVITHYQRLLNYIVPDKVHVIWKGKIVKSGDKSIALKLEEKGYNWIKEGI